MIYLKINDTLYPAELRERTKDLEWNDRRSMSITLHTSYEEVISLFKNDMTWGHVYQDASYIGANGETITPDPIEYDDSEFSVAGSITDNRNGTVTVKMGEKTDGEMLRELLEVLNND